jgi:hypothetical protein
MAPRAPPAATSKNPFMSRLLRRTAANRQRQWQRVLRERVFRLK